MRYDLLIRAQERETLADERFEMLHARAIGWPEDRFEYLGIDDDGDTTAHYAGEVRLSQHRLLKSSS